MYVVGCSIVRQARSYIDSYQVLERAAASTLVSSARPCKLQQLPTLVFSIWWEVVLYNVVPHSHVWIQQGSETAITISDFN